jgi:hypothetical protein
MAADGDHEGFSAFERRRRVRFGGWVDPVGTRGVADGRPVNVPGFVKRRRVSGGDGLGIHGGEGVSGGAFTWVPGLRFQVSGCRTKVQGLRSARTVSAGRDGRHAGSLLNSGPRETVPASNECRLTHGLHLSAEETLNYYTLSVAQLSMPWPEVLFRRTRLARGAARKGEIAEQIDESTGRPRFVMLDGPSMRQAGPSAYPLIAE